jgi:glycerol uptake facilitator-like aquaporin
MDQMLRMYLAELLGTFAVVFVGAGTICAGYVPQDGRAPDVTTIALAEGFTLAVALTATFYVSAGCLNPAITLMLWVVRRLEGAQACGLILMQLLGSILAGLTLRLTFTLGVLESAGFGAPHLRAFRTPAGDVTIGGLLSGIGIEVFLTCLVTVAVFSSLFDWRRPRVGGILVGLAQTAAVLLGFNLTGGAANPARWFGPVVWQMTLPHPAGSPLVDHTVYWVGPILGALLGGYAYTSLIMPTDKERDPVP